MSENCVFCRIVAGEIPATVVYEDEAAVVFRDINPQAKVHLLVVPREHVEPYADGFSNAAAHVLGALFHAAEEAAKAAGVRDSGYRLVVNVGPDAGQEVAHLHMHLLGGEPVGPLVARRG